MLKHPQIQDPFIQYIHKGPNFWDFLISNLGKESLSEIFSIDDSLSEKEFKTTLEKLDLDELKLNELASYIEEIGDQLNIPNLLQIDIRFNATTCAGGVLALPLNKFKNALVFWLRSDFSEKSEILITNENPISYCLEKIISLIEKFEYYHQSVEDFEGMDLWLSQINWECEFDDIIDYCEKNNLIDSNLKSIIKKIQTYES
jgi:hypothetical protein